MVKSDALGVEVSGLRSRAGQGYWRALSVPGTTHGLLKVTQTIDAAEAAAGIADHVGCALMVRARIAGPEQRPAPAESGGSPRSSIQIGSIRREIAA